MYFCIMYICLNLVVVGQMNGLNAEMKYKRKLMFVLFYCLFKLKHFCDPTLTVLSVC